jgi:hypothetical protein
MMNVIKNRISSDRGDSNTISIILWIVFTVVLVIAVGKIIFDAVKARGDKVAACIKNSNNVFTTTQKDANCQ